MQKMIKELTKNLLELKCKYSNIADNKSNIQKLVTVIHFSKEQVELEIKHTIIYIST